MAGFQMAYSLDSQETSSIKDFPLDTLANYQSGAGTNPVTKGDMVILNAGLLRRAVATTAKAIGVVEGVEFVGLVAQGQPYAATNAAFTAQAINTTKYPNGLAKVRVETDTVYRANLKNGQSATNANIGVAYGLYLDAAGNQYVDTTNVANTVVKIIDWNKDNPNIVYCIMATNNTF